MNGSEDNFSLSKSTSISYNQLSSVMIPNSVTSIGDSAFYYNKLISAAIPNSVTDIKDYAFYNNQLTSIAIPDSISSIKTGVFGWNKLTSVTILNSVLSIGEGAFSYNQLSAVTIPDTISTIDSEVFADNQLTTITVPSSITAIKDDAFAFNRLTAVTLPASVTTLSPTAFYGQNPAGGNAYAWYSNPSVVQAVYDSVWYTNVHTEDPANPHGFTDSAVSEDYSNGGYDKNNNGTTRDSLGGSIINPAKVTIRYIDSNNRQLQAEEQLTSAEIGNIAALSDYSVKASALLAPLDSNNPKPTEVTDMQAGFAQYYHLDQVVTITPLAIAGYITPAPQTVHLTSANMIVSMVYAADRGTHIDKNTNDNTGSINQPSNNHAETNDEKLANTGNSATLWAAGSIALIATGSAIAFMRRRP